MIKLGNLTLITTMNICDKRCPFCIAKSSGKIYNETIESKDEFLKLEDILQNLENNGVRFNRLVISGNGEPSFYETEQILSIVETIKKHINMFNAIRIHASGNIFYNKEEFNLFNSIDNIEFNILRVSLNSKEDMKILGYDNFSKELKQFLENNQNIKTVRIKELLCGKEDTLQTKWIKEHKLEKEKIDIMINELLMNYNLNYKLGEKVIFENGKNKLIYGASGGFKYYNLNLIIFNNRLMNYNEENIKIEEIHKLYKNKICVI